MVEKEKEVGDLVETSIFCKRVVRIAVQPALAGLGGGDDRMTGRMRMFAGVLVW